MSPALPSLRDTIVAVSSPPGRSWRGLLRCSGPQAFTILPIHTLGPSPGPSPMPARVPTAVRCLGIPMLATAFPSPRSFTGQDLLELQLPGNPLLLERVIHAALERGARLAEPGEFTYRAFAAGKIDLTQAQGVAATIAASSDAELDAAMRLRHGELGTQLTGLAHRLTELLTLIEAGIDFSDQEDVRAIEPRDAARLIAERLDELHGLLRRSQDWRDLTARPRVVLMGRPSVGKSSLFNALLGRSRAVTHPMPGTTRDALEEACPITPQLTVTLVDLPGLDEPTAALDRQVQQLAREQMDRADLRVQVSDDGRWLSGDALRVASKADQHAHEGDVRVSVVTGQGLAELRAAIASRLGASPVLTGELALLPRQRATLTAAADALTQARATAADELRAQGLREALDHLGQITGAVTPDDVLGRIFAGFCVGK